MKKIVIKFISPFLFLLFVLTKSSYSQASILENPNVDPEMIQKDFRTWWNYNYLNIKLSETYIPLDTASKIISKQFFLELLSSGEYIALRLTGKNSELKYKLYKLSPLVDKDIKTQVKQFAEDGYQKYNMEGTEVPDFNFIDLNGQVFNKETIKGKIVVLKCCFIHCLPCVQEMPALNEVVKQYKKRKDVLFISLAYDSKENLENFLTKTKFDYVVIPVQQKYMEETLKVTRYPTHYIISKNGVISKVVNDYHDMISTLKNEISK